MSEAMKTAFSPTQPYHPADRQFIVMTRGWARFMSEDDEVVIEAGDTVQQRPGLVQYLFDHSSDMEFHEVSRPADS